MSNLEGGCRCGLVRYKVTGEPKFSFACHCTDCQQLSASAFSLGMAVDQSDFAITKGEPHRWTKTGSSGRSSHQFTCPTCAGWTHTRAESAESVVIVRPTTLNSHDWYRPIAQIFTRSALPWATMPDLLGYEKEFDDPAPLAATYKDGRTGPNARETGLVRRLLGSS